MGMNLWLEYESKLYLLTLSFLYQIASSNEIWDDFSPPANPVQGVMRTLTTRFLHRPNDESKKQWIDTVKKLKQYAREERVGDSM